MDSSRFDVLARRLVSGVSRRSFFGGLSTLLFGSSGIVLAPTVEAKKKHPIVPPINQYGCIDVGQKCGSQCALCCSGVFTGKKKKNKKDSRTCAAHNVGNCAPARNICATNEPGLSTCNPNGFETLCFVTTGNAGFCGNLFFFDPDVNCRACNSDNDCVALGFEPGAACVVIQGAPDSFCGDVCPSTVGRACMAPGIADSSSAE